MNSAPINACALVASAFGFGPVSKAVSIAGELKAQACDMEVHYFGSGISYEYAQKANVFDLITNVDVDRDEVCEALLPQLSRYRAVFSIVNLNVLPRWRPELPPLFFVDSLAWMWPAPPKGIENAAAYFVQDYLLPPERVEEWAKTCNLILVGPIVSAATKFKTMAVRHNRLLVNFSGCSNPFAPANLYEQYVRVLASAILEKADQRYGSIVFCCNSQLADYLRKNLASSRSVEIGHYAHEDFLRLFVSSAMVLTAPGITVTLEALALRTPVGFLLPQNDSQALMAERYKSLLGENTSMAFSRFGPEFLFPAFRDERTSVALALELLKKILDTQEPKIHRMITELLEFPASYSISNLMTNSINEWHCSGQQEVVSHVLSHLQTRDRQRAL